MNIKQSFLCAALLSTASLAEEPIRSVSVNKLGISVGVTSTGCTEKKDFEVQLEQLAVPPRIAFLRRNPDRCKVAPHEFQVSFSFNELGIERGENFQIDGETFKITIAPK